MRPEDALVIHFVATSPVTFKSKEEKKMHQRIKMCWIGLLLLGMLTALSGTAQTPASVPKPEEKAALQKELTNLETRLDSLRRRGGGWVARREDARLFLKG